MYLVIEHDNGFKGSRGATIEYLEDIESFPSLFNDYKSSGITIYSVSFCEVETP